MEQRDLSELFLINFIQEIARVCKPASYTENEEIQLAEQYENPEKKLSIEMLPEGIKKFPGIQRGRIIETSQNKLPIRNRQIRFTQRQTQVLPKVEINQKSTADKLNFLIKDPSVTEIECIGSEQNLLVKKGGAIQKTPVTLSIEEIYELIAEFSQKTKIPVLDGTIKAALNNLILTAVLSEILGPRFILQKKNPFQNIVA